MNRFSSISILGYLFCFGLAFHFCQKGLGKKQGFVGLANDCSIKFQVDPRGPKGAKHLFESGNRGFTLKVGLLGRDYRSFAQGSTVKISFLFLLAEGRSSEVVLEKAAPILNVCKRKAEITLFLGPKTRDLLMALLDPSNTVIDVKVIDISRDAESVDLESSVAEINDDRFGEGFGPSEFDEPALQEYETMAFVGCMKH